MTEWRAIKVKQQGLTSVGPIGRTRKRSSGKIVSPWQFDRWSFNPQNLAVVSSPSSKYSDDSSENDSSLDSLTRKRFGKGISIIKLATILLLVFSVFMAGVLLNLVLT